jgi:hypothetical protein
MSRRKPHVLHEHSDSERGVYYYAFAVVMLDDIRGTNVGGFAVAAADDDEARHRCQAMARNMIGAGYADSIRCRCIDRYPTEEAAMAACKAGAEEMRAASDEAVRKQGKTPGTWTPVWASVPLG